MVDPDQYLEAVAALARTHGATRYFAHRRESADKLHRLAAETGLEIVRPDLPLELIARRGPIGRTVLSFPSTVVHTLPLALVGTGVRSPSATSPRSGSGTRLPAGPGLPGRGHGDGPGCAAAARTAPETGIARPSAARRYGREDGVSLPTRRGQLMHLAATFLPLTG